MRKRRAILAVLGLGLVLVALFVSRNRSDDAAITLTCISTKEDLSGFNFSEDLEKIGEGDEAVCFDSEMSIIDLRESARLMGVESVTAMPSQSGELPIFRNWKFRRSEYLSRYDSVRAAFVKEFVVCEGQYNDSFGILVHYVDNGWGGGSNSTVLPLSRFLFDQYCT